MTIYEYPLNERIRTFMRLEDLFAKFDFFASQSAALEHHAALLTLFEILEVVRGDLKSDLIQEMERHRHALELLRNNPEVSTEALDNILQGIGHAVSELQDMPGKAGQDLKENEWVMSIKQRACIPGGVSEFDLPSYHYWLNLPPEVRRDNLETWVGHFMPIFHGLRIVLKILRESGVTGHRVAEHGSFQQMLSGKVAHMLRVALDSSLPCFPEISANKYAINIRFTTLDGHSKPKACDVDVNFDLTLCNL